MNTPHAESRHAEGAQRWQLLERLAAQHALMAARLAEEKDPPAEWPRSRTMRLLVRKPLLVTTAVRWIAGPRIAGVLLVGLTLRRLLRDTAAARGQR